MSLRDFIIEALNNPAALVAYHTSRELAQLHPLRAITEGETYLFDLEEYACASHCTIIGGTVLFNQTITEWTERGKPLEHETPNAWLNVLWRGHLLDVLFITWAQDDCVRRHHWIIADERAVAEEFFSTVCEWNAEVRGEVLVFEDGYWEKNEELFAAIKAQTFETLVLPANLKDEIRRDAANFFANREVYERYGIPWKRGLLFTGAPGNGKTHTIKAIINESGVPCLYVKSFRARHTNDHEQMSKIFSRARQTTPCILVFEDLDALVTEENRSFFLNELDGFAANTGILILATTNHPERLDTAITERPSRFDRCYTFDLPGEAERFAYIRRWNDGVKPEMRLTEEAIREATRDTEDFSFAYLKELFLSAVMEWVAAPETHRMSETVLEQIASLRQQMDTKKKANIEKATNVESKARAAGSGAA